MNSIGDVFLGLTNDTTPRATSFTRGIVAAALTGAANAVLIFLPIDDGQKVAFLSAVNPILILCSYVLYGYLDNIMKRRKNGTN